MNSVMIVHEDAQPALPEPAAAAKDPDMAGFSRPRQRRQRKTEPAPVPAAAAAVAAAAQAPRKGLDKRRPAWGAPGGRKDKDLDPEFDRDYSRYRLDEEDRGSETPAPGRATVVAARDPEPAQPQPQVPPVAAAAPAAESSEEQKPRASASASAAVGKAGKGGRKSALAASKVVLPSFGGIGEIDTRELQQQAAEGSSKPGRGGRRPLHQQQQGRRRVLNDHDPDFVRDNVEFFSQEEAQQYHNRRQHELQDFSPRRPEDLQRQVRQSYGMEARHTRQAPSQNIRQQQQQREGEAYDPIQEYVRAYHRYEQEFPALGGAPAGR